MAPFRSSCTGSLVVVIALLAIGCTPGAETASTVELVHFRDDVLRIARQEFPERRFEATGDPLRLRLGNAELGLSSLLAKSKLAAADAEGLRKLVREQFANSLRAIDGAESRRDLGWELARPLLRLQIVPTTFRESSGMVHRPLAGNLEITCVLDRGNSFEYVREGQVDPWGVSTDELFATALANLERESEPLEIRTSPGPDVHLAIGTGDGYDAARLLLPSLRRRLLAGLGGPFFAAIPHRDLLMLWSARASVAFHKESRERVTEAHRAAAYPLSEAIFAVSEDGIALAER